MTPHPVAVITLPLDIRTLAPGPRTRLEALQHGPSTRLGTFAGSSWFCSWSRLHRPFPDDNHHDNDRRHHDNDRRHHGYQTRTEGSGLTPVLIGEGPIDLATLRGTMS